LILVPANLLDRLNDSQLSKIIQHEIEHVRRYDSILIGIHRIAMALHWFNPAVYCVGRLLRRDMELAVDSRVTNGSDDKSRREYGELLLQLATQKCNRYGLAQMASQGSQIGSRIDAVVKPQRNTWMRSIIAVGLVVVTALLGLTSWTAPGLVA
jgi:bla regulator protein BlaR1